VKRVKLLAYGNYYRDVRNNSDKATWFKTAI
jgi:hypothetical protein